LQWGLRVQGTQIERKEGEVGEAVVGQRREATGKSMIALTKNGEDVAPLAIPRADGQVRTLRCDHTPRGKRRIVEEAFVGIDFDVLRVIDSNEAQLVDVI